MAGFYRGASVSACLLAAVHDGLLMRAGLCMCVAAYAFEWRGGWRDTL